MFKSFVLLVAATGLFCSVTMAGAEERPAGKEAGAMVKKTVAASNADAENNVKKGIAFVKANGREKALAEFSNPKGQFVKSELYIYVINQKGVVIAHGANAKLIGKNLYDLKDAGGKLFIQKILKAPKNGGWVEYQWPNPVSRKIEHKIVYAETTGDMVLICGVYK